MEAVAADYLAMIGDQKSPPIARRNPPIMLSSVTGAQVSPKDLRQGRYWVANMISVVKFSEACKPLFSQPAQKLSHKIDGSHRTKLAINAVVEIGPHSTLQGPIRDILKDLDSMNVDYASVLARNSSGVRAMLTCAGRLFCLGYPIKLASVNRPITTGQTHLAALIDLPEYPFDASRECWLETRISQEYRLGRKPRLDLVGKPAPDWNPLAPRWRNRVKISSELPWVEDHKVNDSVLYPAAGMIVMAVEAANQMAEEAISDVVGFALKDTMFHTALVIPNTPEGIETQFQLHRTGSSWQRDSWQEFKLHAFDNGRFIEICTGYVRVEYGTEEDNETNLAKNEELQQQQNLHQTVRNQCSQHSDASKFYANLIQCNYAFGTTFQRLEDIR